LCSSTMSTISLSAAVEPVVDAHHIAGSQCVLRIASSLTSTAHMSEGQLEDSYLLALNVKAVDLGPTHEILAIDAARSVVASMVS
jgi:hypothetical protein